MLSFVYRLAHTFEREHGYRPNLLYLNHRHYHALEADLPADAARGTLRERLGMEIVLTEEVVHPHVAWTRLIWQRAAG
ncbi:MAG: hypothetical protein AB1450_11470 [Pseudomonadota bacterium]